MRLANSIFYNYSVRVRYAPSPTGMMHIGGLRTALFNYLYAKKNNGKFIVRIQDTDQNRNVPGSVQNIFSTLSWLNINPDESSLNPNKKYQPYVQSERLSLYKNIQKMLLKNNLAYPCFCNQQRKTQSNSQAKKKKKEKNNSSQTENQQLGQQQTVLANAYDGTCSKLTLQEVKQRILKGQPYAVRIRANIMNVPDVFNDQNYGSVPFVKFDDFVIIKKDGWPTFHFANVIDDWKMDVTHVIRGQQWLTNTSKHIYLFKVLGANVPKYLHLPLIQNQNGKKLAKRDPSSSLATLKNQYEAETIKNFIFRLGWNPKQNLNQKQQIQVLSQQQMIEWFSTEGITKSPAKFDIKIMNHLNKKVLKKQWKQLCQLNKIQNPTKSQKSQKSYLKDKFLQKIKKYILAPLENSESYFKAQDFQESRLLLIWQLLHDRITINSDLKDYSYIFSKNKLTYGSSSSLKDLKSLFGPNSLIKIDQNLIQNYEKDYFEKNLKILYNLRLIIEHMVPENQFQQQNIAQKISQFLISNSDVKNEDFYHLLRFIITQRKSGPSILKVMKILGRQRSLKIINDFYNLMQNTKQINDSKSVASFL